MAAIVGEGEPSRHDLSLLAANLEAVSPDEITGMLRALAGTRLGGSGRLADLAGVWPYDDEKLVSMVDLSASLRSRTAGLT